MSLMLLSKFRKPKVVYKSIYFLSRKCSNGCPFCYFDTSNKQETSLDLTHLKSYKPDLIYFSGGEPFEDPEIFDYFFKLDTYVNRIIIFSNIKYIDYTLLNKLSKHAKTVILIINSPYQLLDPKFLNDNIIYFYKIFIDQHNYYDIASKVSNIILSHTVPSIWSQTKQIQHNDIDWSLIRHILKHTKLIRLFDPHPIVNKSYSWFSSYDLFDHYVYYPYKKAPLIKQIGACLTCRYKTDMKQCLQAIKADQCKRISFECLTCEFNHICIFPQSRFLFYDRTRMPCKNIKKLYKLALETRGFYDC